MNVLSLFDGISCGQLALKRAGVKVDKYFASEIDKYAIKCTQHNFPNTIQLGDVSNIDWGLLPKIDLIIGGSPCQGLSRAGKQLGFDDDRSKLFYKFIEAMKALSPAHVFFENVDSKFNDVITDGIGIRPVTVDSNRFSAQNRKRLYWSTLDPVYPKRAPVLRSIIEYGTSTITDEFNVKWAIDKEYNHFIDAEVPVYSKPHGYYKGGIKRMLRFPTLRSATPSNYAILDSGIWRKLTPQECEVLQTVPKGYTSSVSKTQRYKLLGNCWTVDVVASFFKGLK